MKNQFVYSRKIKKEKEEVEVKDSFNIEYVIRSITMDDGNLLVLLNDIHDRHEDVVSTNKNGKKSLMKRMNTVQSEITLSKEDGERFHKLAAI